MLPLTVGWEEWVVLPELGIPAIKAKIDTGARTSSLHAYAIEPYGRKNRIRFKVRPLPERPELEIHCTAKMVDQREVTSSNGESELRYIIETKLTIGSETWPIEISLTNRESMAYKMLIGRTTLADKLVVQPNLSFLQGMLSTKIYDNLPASKSYHRQLKIGILSREPFTYSTQRLVEAAEDRGHTVKIIDTLRCYMNINSDRPEVHYDRRKLDDFDAIIPRIGASITFYGMAVVRQFEMMGTYCLNSSTAIGSSRDKLYAHQLLSRKKIGMPVTGFAHSLKDTEHVINIVGGTPLVLKLLEGTQGRGVVLAETRKAAESVITAFQGLNANILVQQFIAEAGGADIRCLVIGNKVVATMMRQAAEGEYRSNLHRGGSAAKIKITPEERKTAIDAAKALGLNVAGVDLLRAKDGPKVLEVNSSPGLEGIEKVSGKDIASLVIEYLEKHARPVVFKPAETLLV